MNVKVSGDLEDPGPVEMQVPSPGSSLSVALGSGEVGTCSLAACMGAVRSKEYWRAVWERFWLEVLLVLANFPHLVIKVVIMAYGAQVPFRNLAYYRHVQGPPLKDLGFEIIPELSESVQFVSELNLYANHLFVLMLLSLSWFRGSAHKTKMYAVYVAMYILNCLFIGHVLRFFTYISTSLPGPAPHCQPGAETYSRPTGVKIWYRLSDTSDLNCGDLMFSGHQFQVMTLTMGVTHFRHGLCDIKWLRVLAVCILWGSVVAQMYFIVGTRNHYTVDVVVSAYFTPALWFALQHFYTTKQYEFCKRFFKFLLWPYFGRKVEQHLEYMRTKESGKEIVWLVPL
mmetsp:Transcript_21220/g.35563  ORF Transcript_21220/g.35563 Transcript_21220/m.35563 type:complete len:341 (-) Transcript_21220:61-1083(-)